MSSRRTTITSATSGPRPLGAGTCYSLPRGPAESAAGRPDVGFNPRKFKDFVGTEFALASSEVRYGRWFLADGMADGDPLSGAAGRRQAAPLGPEGVSVPRPP